MSQNSIIRDKLPIKFFGSREVDHSSVEAGGSKDTPNWVLQGDFLEERSQHLLAGFNNFEAVLAKKRATESIIPLLYKAKLDKDATAKTRRAPVAEMLRTRPGDNVVGLSDENELIVRLDTLEELQKISARLRSFSRNAAAISCLEEISPFEPDLQIASTGGNHKARLLDIHDYDLNKLLMVLFERALANTEIEFKKTDYAFNYAVYSLQIDQAAKLDELKKTEIFEVLHFIEPMPQYTVRLDSLGMAPPTIAVQRPVEGKDYVTLGILDSGIAAIPHLEPWLEGAWSPYPDIDIDQSHGTFVAGVALYGDQLEGVDWVSHDGLKILDAAVFPNPNRQAIYEDELVANIRRAVRVHHQDVKVWNLSISQPKEINDHSFSDFAMALDALADEYNVLIFKSAGNCDNFCSYRPIGRLHQGADSVRSVVVGSVAHQKGEHDLSEVDHPSPFSRLGPGPAFIIKPEISHYGGNAGLNPNGQPVTTGVTSFAPDGNCIQHIGTSFSTPRVAALAAGLYQNMNEDFDPLLLKALIIHSASYSDALSIPVTERTKYLGFGVPKRIDDILFNAPHEVTLILRENLPKGQFYDILDFPMPDCLVGNNGFYTGQIIVTLVYDPVLEASQGPEYCQSNIDVAFGSYDAKTDRDTSKRNILNAVGRAGTANLLNQGSYSKILTRGQDSEFARRERLLIQYGDKYYPVKKYAVDLAELTEGNKQKYLAAPKLWFLKIKGLFRDFIETQALVSSSSLSQEFCLIITIRDGNGIAPVYNGVTQKLDQMNFWHNNIKVSGDVAIRV